MKFSVDQDKFDAAVKRVAATAAVKSPMAILTNVLVEADWGQITLTASDLTARATSTVEAKVEKLGSTTVSAKGLLNRVVNLDGKITAEMVKDQFSIKAGHRRYTLTVMAAEDYPHKAAPGGETVSFPFPAAELSSLLSRTVYATGTNPDRAYLMNVTIASKDNGVRAYAVDGHRFAVVRSKVQTPSFDIAIPSSRCREIVKLLHGVDDDVQLHVAPALLTIQFPWGEFSTAISGDHAPDIDQILNSPHDEFTGIVERSKLLESVKALFAAIDTSQNIELALSNDELELRTDSGLDKVSVTEGPSQHFSALCIKYLVDALSAIPDATVKLALSCHHGGSTEEGIVFLYPEEGSDWVSGMMPVRK